MDTSREMNTTFSFLLEREFAQARFWQKWIFFIILVAILKAFKLEPEDPSHFFFFSLSFLILTNCCLEKSNFQKKTSYLTKKRRIV
jgi:hypothetical protein